MRGALAAGLLEAGYTATALQDGRVLIAGGIDDHSFALDSAELFDPRDCTFVPTGYMTTPRFGHRAALLRNGKVLLVGGYSSTSINFLLAPLATAELYDPWKGTFTATGNMSVGRNGFTATALAHHALKGKVLIAGGTNQSLASCCQPTYGELFDPKTGSFSMTGNASIARTSPTAVLLRDGEVLLMGGSSFSKAPLRSAEVFDPDTATFRPVQNFVPPAIFSFVPNPLAALITKGPDRGDVWVSAFKDTLAELYDPGSEAFIPTVDTPDSFDSRFTTATGVCGGDLLVVTEASLFDPTEHSSGQLYNPRRRTFADLGETAIHQIRSHTATLLDDGRVLVIGAIDDNGQPLPSAQLYDP